MSRENLSILERIQKIEERLERIEERILFLEHKIGRPPYRPFPQPGPILPPNSPGSPGPPPEPFRF